MKTTFLKGFKAVTLVGFIGMVLGSSLIPATQAHAAGVLLVSVAITESPSTICAGQSAHITWSSTNATSILITPSIGSVNPFGSIDVSPTQTTTYTITGSNTSGGFGTASATVFVSGSCVTPTPTPVSTLNLIANPSSTVNSVGNTTLIWNSTNVSNCVATANPANNQWSGAVNPNGSQVIYGINTNTTFAIGCYSPSYLQSVAFFSVANATPTPTPYPSYGSVTINHSVSDLTRGGQGTYVTAYSGDRLQFTTTIMTNSQGTLDLHVRDWLPSYTTYVSGSTRVNGAFYGDGIATGNTNDSLAIPDMGPYQTLTVVFDAMLNNAPNVNLTNNVSVHTRGVPDQNRTSTISVVGTPYTYYPTPTPYVNPLATNTSLSAVEYGRNVTAGQSGEHTSVVGRGNDTLDFILHVRNGSASSMSNVYITNVLPMGLRYIAQTTSLNNLIVADGITTSGINIGTLYAGQEAVVRFSVIVDPASVPAWGQVDLLDTAQIRADGVNTISTQLPVTLGNSLSIAAISRIKTGPADTILLALLLGVVATGLYAMYTNTEMFGRRFAHAQIRQIVARKNSPNFLG